MNRFTKEFSVYYPFLKQLIRRNFRRKYYKSSLGVFWAVLHPLIMMAIKIILFSTLFERSIPNFPVYYLCGWLMFHLNSDATTQSLSVIIGNSGLINKIRVPKYFFPLAQVCLSLINISIAMIPFILAMIVTRLPLSWTMLLGPIPFLLVFLFALGLSLALSALTVYFRDMAHLYGLVVMAWMYLTPMFYPITIVPERFRFWWNFNPMFHYVNMMRDLFLYATLPDMTTVLCAAGFSMVSLLAGCFIFAKLQDAFFLHI